MAEADPLAGLSDNQRAVARLIVTKNLTNKELATALNRGINSIKQDVGAILRHFDVHRRSDLIRKLRWCRFVDDRAAEQLDRDKMFRSSPEGQKRLTAERKLGSCWWEDSHDSDGWYDDYFTFWAKSVAVSPHDVTYELDENVRLDAETVGWGEDAPWDKVTLLDVP